MNTEELIFAVIRRTGFPENGAILLAGCGDSLPENIRGQFPGAAIRHIPDAMSPVSDEAIRLAVFGEGLPADLKLKVLYHRVVPDGLLVSLERFDAVAAPAKGAKTGRYLNDLLRAARKAGFNPEFRLLGGTGNTYLVTLKRHAVPQAKALQVYMNTVSQSLIDHG